MAKITEIPIVEQKNIPTFAPTKKITIMVPVLQSKRYEMGILEVHSFYAEVYSIVAEIPRGKVLTYGDIAALSGYPNHSRLVGRALRDVPSDSPLPCHRVINASGKLSPCFPDQRSLLEAEGVTLNRSGTVNLKQFRWNIELL